MNTNEYWKKIYNEFDPSDAILTPEQRADRDYSPADDISAGLELSFGKKKYLFTGSRGTGKSTELYRIAEKCVNSHFVVFFDVDRHFQNTVQDPSAINNLQSWELLFLVGLAVHRAGTAHFNHPWNPETTKALERAASALLAESPDAPTIDVAKLASSVFVIAGGATAAAGGVSTAGILAGAGLVAFKAVAAASSWVMPIGRTTSGFKDAQDGKVQAMRLAVDRAIQELQANYRNVLVLLDGLDRMTNQDCVEALLVDSSLLPSLTCDLVAVAPLLIRSGLASEVRGFLTRDLVNIPVVKRDGANDPPCNVPLVQKTEDVLSQYGPGIEFFEALTTKRLRNIGIDGLGPFSKLQIAHLAWCSGGRTREFVNLILRVAMLAAIAKTDTVTDGIIDAAANEARRARESNINRDEVELLHGVLKDPNKGLPGSKIAAALLYQNRLIPFPNDTTWYYPHPLLTMNLVK